MQLNDFQILGKLDFQLIEDLEEWVDGTYRIDKDFHRLTIYTERAQKALWHLFGKMVPLNSRIKLSKEELNTLKTTLWSDKTYKLCGTYGGYRVNSFTVSTFYGKEDAVATDEELAYESEWSDLFGLE